MSQDGRAARVLVQYLGDPGKGVAVILALGGSQFFLALVPSAGAKKTPTPDLHHERPLGPLERARDPPVQLPDPLLDRGVL